MIPKAIQKNLPFKSKPKDTPSRRKKLLEDRRAVVREPHELKISALVQNLMLIRSDKVFILILSSQTSLSMVKFVINQIGCSYTTKRGFHITEFSVNLLGKSITI